jgi:sugar phosphate isomerase/epimerase
MEEWPWICFWEAQGKSPKEQLLVSMQESREAGYECWEAGLPEDEAAVARLAETAKKGGLALHSAYANIGLHDAKAQQECDSIERRCKEALKQMPLKVLVANPNATEAEKSEAEIKIQQGAWAALSERLKPLGISLAYHIHSADMRGDGREFLAMADGVPSLQFCLELEWMCRGGWKPSKALDFMKARAGRVASVHLRQSKAGEPLLEFQAGDIDYASAAVSLKEAGFTGPLIHEGYRQGPCTLEEMRGVLRRSASYSKSLF